MKVNGRKPSLTAAQADYVRRCEAIRKRWLRRIPTRKQLAGELGVSVHAIANAALGSGRKHHEQERREALSRVSA